MSISALATRIRTDATKILAALILLAMFFKDRAHGCSEL